MNLDLANYTALVCGSTQGIGLATAKELALAGARVILFARNEESLKTALTVLSVAHGQQHSYLVADFNQPEEVKAAIENYILEFGTIHIVINNSGGPPGGTITAATPDAFLSAFRQHVISSHVIMQCVLNKMKEAGYGRFINIISTSVKQPLRGLGVSNTIRAAMANWAKTLSAEVAPYGITVNNILPGATATGRLTGLLDARSRNTNREYKELELEMLHEIPAGRFALPEEIAAAATFLAGPAAAYINGINLPVDGGRTLSL